MGACGISKTVETTDIKKVWKELHDNASSRWTGDYCEDSAYSGDWNTVRLGSIKKVFDKYSESKTKAYLKKNGEKLWDDLYKCDSITLDLGVTGYEVWSVKKSTPKNKKAPKYETKFVVYHLGGDWGHEEIEDAAVKTATEANNKALKLAMENDRIYHVKKARVLVSGTEETADFRIVKTTYKSKPKNVKKGGVLKEVHKYHIMGMASC